MGLVFDEAPRIARRLVEVDDDPVRRRRRIEFALGHTPDAQIGTGFAERPTLSKGLDRIHLNFDIGHREGVPFEVDLVPVRQRAGPSPQPSPRKRGEGEPVYESGRLVTKLTGWIGDRF